jgi:hypothetical protein
LNMTYIFFRFCCRTPPDHLALRERHPIYFLGPLVFFIWIDYLRTYIIFLKTLYWRAMFGNLIIILILLVLSFWG